MPKLSVVIPVYFNEDSLRPLFQELQVVAEKLQQRGLEMEIICVDDGSGDQSLATLLELKQQHPADTKVVKLTRNFGANPACLAGTHFVTGDCFTFLSADLQDPPQLVLEMVDLWLMGHRFVVCARGGRRDPGLTGLWANLFYRIVRLLIIRDYPHGGYDLCLMDKVFLRELKRCGKNVNISLFIYWLGFKPKTILYQRQARQHGKSRWTLVKKIKLFFDSLLGFSPFPMRLISSFGLLVSTLSFAYGSYIFISTLTGGVTEPGFASVVSLITFLLGLIIIMLGLIGEYIWRIYDQVNGMPESVIDEVY